MFVDWLHWLVMVLCPQFFGTGAQRLADDEEQMLLTLAGRRDRRRTCQRLGLRRWRAAVARAEQKGDLVVRVTGEGPLRPEELPVHMVPDACLYLTRAGWARIGEPLADTDIAALRWVYELGPGACTFKGPINDRLAVLGLVAEGRGVTMAGLVVLQEQGATT
jgi:hypothetical protein